MKNVSSLIASAAEFVDRGFLKGETADEPNVSREIANWLVERSGAVTEPEFRAEPEGPDDIYVDWNTIGSGGRRLIYVGCVLVGLLTGMSGEADVVVGIGRAGVPPATFASREFETTFGAYSSMKYQWNEGDLEDPDGGFSRNFSPVEGHDCFIVDGMVTSSTTLREIIDAIRSEGDEPLACVVVVDKQDVEGIDGAPVYSFINVVRAGGQ